MTPDVQYYAFDRAGLGALIDQTNRYREVFGSAPEEIQRLIVAGCLGCDLPTKLVKAHDSLDDLFIPVLDEDGSPAEWRALCGVWNAWSALYVDGYETAPRFRAVVKELERAGLGSRPEEKALTERALWRWRLRHL